MFADPKRLEQVIHKGSFLGCSCNGNVAIGMDDGDIIIITLDPSDPAGVHRMEKWFKRNLKSAIYFEGKHDYVDLRARPMEELKLAAKGYIKEEDVRHIQDVISISRFEVDKDLTINGGYAFDIGIWCVTD